MKPLAALLALLLLTAAPGKDAPTTAKPETPPPAAKEPVVELDPFKVHEKPIISFAVDIVVRTDPATGLVTRIFITRVLPRTDAERAGLQAGDEIVKLAGTPVGGLDATVAAGTRLGRHLLGRDPGDELTFTIAMRRTRECTLHAAKQENGNVGFAADLVVYADPQTREVTKVFIGRVRTGTDAEKAGLQGGDEIVKLGDTPVHGIDSALTPDSLLGRLLLNRNPGEPLKFEVTALRTQEVTLKAQRGLPFVTR